MRLDVGVRVRRAHEHGVGLARAVDVVGVLALAGDEALVFLAAYGRADAGCAHGVPPEICSCRAARVRRGARQPIRQPGACCPWRRRRRARRRRCCDSPCSGRCCLRARARMVCSSTLAALAVRRCRPPAMIMPGVQKPHCRP